MVTMEEQLPEQQRQAEEEEEEEETGAALETRRSRKSYASVVAAAAAAVTTSDAGSNGVHEQKPRNGGEEEIGSGLGPEIKSEKNVYYDKDEGTEAVHESATESSGLKVSASLGDPNDDGLEVTINTNDVQKNENGAANYLNNYILKDEGLCGLRSPPLEKSKEEHNSENNGFVVSVSFGKSGDNGGVVIVNNSDSQSSLRSLPRENSKEEHNSENNGFGVSVKSGNHGVVIVNNSDSQSSLRSLPQEKSKEEHNSENNGFGVSGSFGKSGDNGGVVIVNSSSGQGNQNGVVSNQCKEILEEESFAGLKSVAPEKLKRENEADVSSNVITAACEDIDLIEEIDSESTDIDLDGVLKTQNTHDLYCPNCNSCITRRVILRKRKRHIPISGDDAKRKKGGKVILSNVDTISSHATSDERHDAVDTSLDDPLPLSADGINRDSEPDVFRCLSCLSFFIPTGDGLKLFKIFGSKSKSESQGTQVSEPILAEKKNWLSSMFVSRKGSKQNDQVKDRVVDSEENIVRQSNEVKSPAQSLRSEVHVNDRTGESQRGGDNVVPSSKQGPELLVDRVIEQTSEGDELICPELHTNQQFSTSSITFSSNENNHSTTKVSWRTPMIAEESAEAVTSRPQQDGLNILVNSSTDQKFNMAIERDSADNQGSVLSMPQPATAPEEIDKNEEVNVVADVPSENGQNVASPLPKRPAIEDEKMKFTINEGAELIRPELHTVQQFSTSSIIFSSNENNHPTTTVSWRTPMIAEESAEAVTSRPQQDGLNILVSSSTDQKFNMAIERDSADDKGSVLSTPKPATIPEESDKNEEVNVVSFVPSENGQNVGPPHPKRPEIENEKMKFTINDVSFETSLGTTTGTTVDIHVEQPLKANNVAFPEDSLFSQRGRLDSQKDLKDLPVNSSAGSDTVVVIERLVEQVASQEVQSTLSSAQPLLGSERTDDRSFHSLEIVKSIVYGGLAESIASLAVVSSAAGADTTTLNILALGLANLIGGLFVIFHDLWDLKSDIAQETTRLDRYRELLGRRQNFVLHAAFAILSYLVFGLLPPVVYGFSFRASDDTNFKLIAVAIASLVCIILLSVGKAYTQRPTKAYMKTVSYYVVMGFLVSGVSYAAGGLIKKLMDRLGLFDTSPGLSLNFPVLETMPVQSGWGSY